MLESMSGISPVLMALTGDDPLLGRGKKKHHATWFSKNIGKIGKVAAMMTLPGAAVVGTIEAKKAIDRRNKAIKARRARARAAQAAQKAATAPTLKEKVEAIQEQAQAQHEVNTAPVDMPPTESRGYGPGPTPDSVSMPSPEPEPMPEPEAEAPVDAESPDAEPMEGNYFGYAMTNDDLLVGTVKAVPVVKNPFKSGQIKTVSSPKLPLTKGTIFVGAIVLGAIIFHKQLKRSLHKELFRAR